MSKRRPSTQRTRTTASLSVSLLTCVKSLVQPSQARTSRTSETRAPPFCRSEPPNERSVHAQLRPRGSPNLTWCLPPSFLFPLSSSFYLPLRKSTNRVSTRSPTADHPAIHWAVGTSAARSAPALSPSPIGEGAQQPRMTPALWPITWEVTGRSVRCQTGGSVESCRHQHPKSSPHSARTGDCADYAK